MSAQEKKEGYRTQQKTALLEYLKAHRNEFCSPESMRSDLNNQGVRVSLVTIYRFLDKLAEDGDVVRVSSSDGKRGLYRYSALDEKDFSHGRMICLECGKLLPLECSLLETFYEHVQKEHGCELNYAKTVLYCVCPECLAKKSAKSL